ncbi:MAG TPA: BCAM0308 family protein [Burkholderiales bacterium]|nr:BCAM0308 family protein [Burkholderiales bacterium]
MSASIAFAGGSGPATNARWKMNFGSNVTRGRGAAPQQAARSLQTYVEPKRKAVPAPASCSDCNAVYYEGQWRWGAVPLSANETRCPACERLRRRLPAATLTLQGASVAKHRDEFKRVALKREQALQQDNPLQRIMDMVPNPRGMTITTTEVQLARDIGEALREVYGGSLVAEYDKQGMLQVRWAR